MVTLEISSTEIKLMEIEGGRVIRWASHSLEAGLFEGEVISARRALGDAVKQLMASSGIRGGNITASVSGLYSLSRIVMVPNPIGRAVTRREVLEVVQEVIPFSEDELYLSWQTLATIEGGYQVLVVAVPRDVVDSEMQALRGAGVNPRILDLKTMALARAVNREQAIILNIQSTSFDVVMVVDGLVEVMRTTAWQSGDLTVEEKAEHLSVALELTAGFYNSHHSAFPLDPATPLFITGQMSGDITLLEELQARLTYPFEPLAPPLECPAHLPVSQYAVNIGLALKGTASSQGQGQASYSFPDINLLPQVYQPWKPTARQMYLAAAMVVAIALLFPLYQVITEATGETAILKARYDVINSELERRQAEIQNRQPLQAAINQYDTIVNMGGNFIRELEIKNSLIEVINSLAEELGVEVGSISYDSSSITFSCQADNYITFRKYIIALEESGRFFTPVTPPEGYPYVKGGTIELKPKPSE